MNFPPLLRITVLGCLFGTFATALSAGLPSETGAWSSARVGFPLARLEGSQVSRSMSGRRKGGLRLLPAGRQVEVVSAVEDGQVQVMGPDLVVQRVPARALSAVIPDPRPETTAFRSAKKDLHFEPYRHLAEGLRYFWCSTAGARLHVVEVDLSEATGLELRPCVTSMFHEKMAGTDRWFPVEELARRHGALAAVNGTFFVTGSSRRRGQPLGPIVVEGDEAFSFDDVSVLDRERSVLVFTSDGRLVIGESDASTREIVAQEAVEGLSDLKLRGGERILHLMGGLGRLIQDGDVQAWRAWAGRQFDPSYYSRWTRRPQTCIAVDRTGKRALLLAQEGAPHGERRMSVPELACVLRDLGAWNAVFADGGGSTELFVGNRAVVRTENFKDRRPNATALLVIRR